MSFALFDLFSETNIVPIVLKRSNKMRLVEKKLQLPTIFRHVWPNAK